MLTIFFSNTDADSFSQNPNIESSSFRNYFRKTDWRPTDS